MRVSPWRAREPTRPARLWSLYTRGAMTRRCASLLGLWILCAAGCEPEKPPAPAAKPAVPVAEAGEAAAAALPADAKDAILTYAGDRGQFKDTSKPDEVPEEARGLVRVTLLQGPE